MSDLFETPVSQTETTPSYTAQDIEVLEGLEPVRKRPGMYIGGTDETALHHLVSEIFDNSMDEAVAGFASKIELEILENGSILVSDNGRGIPTDPHPKYPGKSALEVIMTTLHAGGKFGNKVYETSGGLHGVGVSVVNALSDHMEVTVTRDGNVWQQTFSKGMATSELTNVGTAGKKRSGTRVIFHPDSEIFDSGIRFRPSKLYRLASSKAYLFKGVQIHWKCAPSLINNGNVPEEEVIHFPNGLRDFLDSSLKAEELVSSIAFAGESTFPEKKGKVEWAINWIYRRDASVSSYCNTVPTPNGGTHELGLRNALLKGLKEFGDMTGNKKAASITAEDVFGNVFGIISLFISDPQFQGQTKDRLSNRDVSKHVENAVRDRFDLWLTDNKTAALELLQFVLDRTEERLSRRQEKEITRKSPTQKLRLPGKLADCTKQTPEGTEVFLVEGDSAGGSAKMARDRATQAILPLRGKILNVASATKDKIRNNQEISDLNLALGCGTGEDYSEADLRYEKVIIMTDADVDGAHIASLLMTYFFTFLPKLIREGHLYLAQPPLFKITQGAKSHYALTPEEKDCIVKELSKKNQKVDISRFKGLGEMTPAQLKETTMVPGKRTLLRVIIDEETQQFCAQRVDELMGKKPELRFKFISEQTQLLGDNLQEQIDI
jgi:topoisomerase-4 subunit B